MFDLHYSHRVSASDKTRSYLPANSLIDWLKSSPRAGLKMKLLLVVLVAVLLLVPDTGAIFYRRRSYVRSRGSIARRAELELIVERVLDEELTLYQAKKTANDNTDTSPAGYLAALRNVAESYRETKMHLTDGDLDPLPVE
ncbi:uncharacterized protein [Asterias amurensis]|uniref:uncharacterized protein n=1 Tax=Asterias amurensis TaxID=7602 RepID=UPI003AB8B0AA